MSVDIRNEDGDLFATVELAEDGENYLSLIITEFTEEDDSDQADSYVVSLSDYEIRALINGLRTYVEKEQIKP